MEMACWINCSYIILTAIRKDVLEHVSKTSGLAVCERYFSVISKSLNTMFSPGQEYGRPWHWQNPRRREGWVCYCGNATGLGEQRPFTKREMGRWWKVEEHVRALGCFEKVYRTEIFKLLSQKHLGHLRNKMSLWYVAHLFLPNSQKLRN